MIPYGQEREEKKTVYMCAHDMYKHVHGTYGCVCICTHDIHECYAQVCIACKNVHIKYELVHEICEYVYVHCMCVCMRWYGVCINVCVHARGIFEHIV